ncbi:hypothetical protein J1907_17950 [Lysinibacillus sphaericus]|uniref:hypothetical protein n=1 Tax=Lysinibacillus sphaericus TaxID=1421 RepID=UPI000565814F|nr:hypothetical protein [Lysinibacillus sphaericus]QTB21609.1 hypothetical protein J1907_17950 [Lysinibacillus sphaericus]
MQSLVVYQKSDRKVIAVFEMNTFVIDMRVLVIPGVAYLVTLEKEIFYTAPDGTVYVKEI